MMVKKISCKVISSVPLGQINAGLLSVRLSNNTPYELDDLTAADLGFKHNRNMGHNLKAFNIGIGIMNSFPIGQILDCRA
jgi:hypothetical protein